MTGDFVKGVAKLIFLNAIGCEYNRNQNDQLTQ